MALRVVVESTFARWVMGFATLSCDLFGLICASGAITLYIRIRARSSQRSFCFACVVFFDWVDFTVRTRSDLSKALSFELLVYYFREHISITPTPEPNKALQKGRKKETEAEHSGSPSTQLPTSQNQVMGRCSSVRVSKCGGQRAGGGTDAAGGNWRTFRKGLRG